MSTFEEFMDCIDNNSNLFFQDFYSFGQSVLDVSGCGHIEFSESVCPLAPREYENRVDKYLDQLPYYADKTYSLVHMFECEVPFNIYDQVYLILRRSIERCFQVDIGIYPYTQKSEDWLRDAYEVYLENV